MRRPRRQCTFQPGKKSWKPDIVITRFQITRGKALIAGIIFFTGRKGSFWGLGLPLRRIWEKPIFQMSSQWTDIFERSRWRGLARNLRSAWRPKNSSEKRWFLD